MRRRGVLFAVVLLVGGCSGEASAPTPRRPATLPEVASVPQVAFALPSHEGRTKVPLTRTREVEATRKVLTDVVRRYALDAENPWAIAHGMLALGTNNTLDNGKPMVPYLFEEYAEAVRVGDETFVRFPKSRGDIRIEPHTDLILKALTEAGAAPTDTVVVKGATVPLANLHRYAMYRSWVRGNELSYAEWNDTPWSLQGLATWAPPGLTWTAIDGSTQSIDRLTSAVVAKLVDADLFLHKADKEGTGFQKRGQGIFAYTCGGAHLHQGAAYAVARGFGTAADREAVIGEASALFYRFQPELDQVDEALKLRPDLRLPLLMQRLKFTGHFVETTQKLTALGLLDPDDDQRKVMQDAMAQLVATVAILVDTQVFDRLPKMRDSGNPDLFQYYLDYVGDSAHALHGLDIAVGEAVVRY